MFVRELFLISPAAAAGAPQLEDVEVSGSDYIRPLLLGNFRGAWEQLDPASEREDDYGLGPRENLQVTCRQDAGSVGSCLSNLCNDMCGVCWLLRRAGESLSGLGPRKPAVLVAGMHFLLLQAGLVRCLPWREADMQ
jgi:hypothetical protein